MNFDLNIDNYKPNELLDMFGLPQIYDHNSLETSEKTLTDTIYGNNTISQEVKNKTITFIVKAKNILMKNAMPSSSSQFKLPENLFHLSDSDAKIKLESPQEHMIQEAARNPYLSTSIKQFAPGVFNPLKRDKNVLFLNIDSRFRDNYYSSSSTNYNLTLSTNFTNVLTINFVSLELPNSYYAVSKQFGNNFFTLIVEGESPVVINVPNGNYSISGMVNYLNAEMTKLGGNFQYITFNVNIDIIGDGTNQMIVNIDPSKNLSFSLNFQANEMGVDDKNTPLPLKLGWKLGFRNGIYENSTTYVSEGVVSLGGPQYMYLVIDDHNNNVNNNFYGIFNSSLLNKNILARIAQSNPPYSTVFSANNYVSYPRFYYGPVNIQNLSIQLLDEYGRIVDLNNMDFSFCLSLETVYNIR